MEKRNLLFEHGDLILILVIYSFLAFFSINYHHYRLGADGMSYIAIAENYLKGDWTNAINGYWSPLYSWLMTPIISFGFKIDYAAYVTRVVSLIVGFFTIIGLSRLSSTFKLHSQIKRALLITSIPMILFFAIYYDTPDLLVVCLLVYYFSIIFNENYSDSWVNGALCGFFGGIAFLSKTYILLFFLAHFIFFNLLYSFKGLKLQKSGVRKNFIIGLAIFLVISGIWIGTISTKYDKLTIGTSTEYNHALIGPEYQNHPVYFVGLIEPPNPSATSTWENPSLVKLNDWSPFESGEYFEFQLKTIYKTLLQTTIIIEYYSILSLAIIIMSLYFIFRSDTKKSLKDKLIYLMVTIFIYTSGYLLIFIQERYLWPTIILIMFCGFILINSFEKKSNLNMKYRNIFLVILMFSFIFAPAYELLIYPSTDSSGYVLSKTLKNDYGIQGNIASNNLWGETLEVTYYLNSKYYGLPKNTNNSQELQNELEACNIDYYFVWGDSNNVNLSDYREITNGKIQGLCIYKRT
ncbi:MAG: hypothetical protein B655_2030 [Methanobacterium sp. Maddingley MBC34]|nr:MAG: hypothetical protein B655_2030 [Methanobacterium sp. Maddingley MBC34]